MVGRSLQSHRRHALVWAEKREWIAPLLQSLSEEVSSNMLYMIVTLLVSNESSGWLKDEAPWNIPNMVVTRLVSNEASDWLKDEAE